MTRRTVDIYWRAGMAHSSLLPQTPAGFKQEEENDDGKEENDHREEENDYDDDEEDDKV